jgi:hypothetical protein
VQQVAWKTRREKSRFLANSLGINARKARRAFRKAAFKPIILPSFGDFSQAGFRRRFALSVEPEGWKELSNFILARAEVSDTLSPNDAFVVDWIATGDVPGNLISHTISCSWDSDIGKQLLC